MDKKHEEAILKGVKEDVRTEELVKRWARKSGLRPIQVGTNQNHVTKAQKPDYPRDR